MSLTPEPNSRSLINAFNASVPSIAQITNDAQMGPVIENTLTSVLSHLGIHRDVKGLVGRIVQAARWSDRDNNYECATHDLLATAGILGRVSGALSGRAALIRDQIMPFVKGGTLADLGCGDGAVGKLLSLTGVEVALSDVYEHPDVSRTGLSFTKLSQIDSLPYASESIDCALVLTVFHHCDDPFKLLQEAARILRPNGRLVVIESVYGVNGVAPGLQRTAENLAFVGLTAEQQRLSNIYFDHFYNRIVHYSSDPATKVNVPFNFNTPEEWERLFKSAGLTQTRLTHLGIDQPVVPEYHTLHVCDKSAL
jgi:ubiquinone/menaquinone biosynthesis C-methylase UbiE